jgi:hypothetical protein
VSETVTFANAYGENTQQFIDKNVNFIITEIDGFFILTVQRYLREINRSFERRNG